MIFESAWDLLFNISITIVIFSVTVLCGLSLTCYFIRNPSITELISISFGLGIIIFALSGIIGVISGSGIFFPQLLALIISVISLIFSRKRFSLSQPDKYECAGAIFSIIYILLLISTLTVIGLWRAGDPSIHASLIKLIIDTQQIPLSIPPFGSAWDYYPKAFHIYSSFFSGIAPISTLILALPALICGIIPLVFYSLIRQYAQGFTSMLACIAISFFFPIQYAILIWGGYPTATAFLLLLVFFILIHKNYFLSSVFLGGILITHTRLIGFAIPVMILDYLLNKFFYEKINLQKIIIVLLIPIFIFFTLGYYYLPSQYLLPVVTEKESFIHFCAMWFFSCGSLIGILIGWKENKKLWNFGIIWTLVIIFYFFIADLNIGNPLQTAPDRIIALGTIPMSIFFASFISSIYSRISHKFFSFIVLLCLIISLTIFGMVFSEFEKSWKLPDKDEKAMDWLSKQNLNNTICLNPDGTGTWVYPLTGIQIGFNPIIYPYSETEWDDITINLSQNPNNPALIKALKEKNHPIIVYISSITKEDGAYETPFRRYYHLPVSNMNLSFSEQYYKAIYCDGTTIYRFVGN